MLTVRLAGTDIESRAHEDWVIESGEVAKSENSNARSPDWMDCRVRNGKFVGAGSPDKLRAIVEQFRAWALASHP